MEFQIAIVGTIGYFLWMVVGNVLYSAIIKFEWYGGDPRKRSFGNRMLSFYCCGVLIYSTICGSILELFFWIGPVGEILATTFSFVR